MEFRNILREAGLAACGKSPIPPGSQAKAPAPPRWINCLRHQVAWASACQDFCHRLLWLEARGEQLVSFRGHEDPERIDAERGADREIQKFENCDYRAHGPRPGAEVQQADTESDARDRQDQHQQHPSSDDVVDHRAVGGGTGEEYEENDASQAAY